MPLPAGSQLSHYTILGPLGAGAMGEVYRAKDGRLGREVAIKVLPEHFADDEDRLHRFEREAKTLASLNHPNVAQIHGVDQVDGACFLVLELVPGESLEDRLAKGPLPLDEAIDSCRQVAEGLEAAHEAGVIHRDLKPANVRLTPDGKVKVLDFGLAKPAHEGAHGSSTDSVLATEAGRLLGTPTYMAPEQARGKPIDKRVDIWAFGCVLYECLTARRAFTGETLSDVLAAVIGSEPDWTRLPSATPARLRELIERCLRKDAASRLRDVGDARVVLAELGGRIALPRGVVEAGGATRGGPAGPGRAAPASGPGRAVLLVAAGVALGALLAWGLWHGAASEPRAPGPLQVALAVPGFSGPNQQFAAHPTISRDGRWVAYPGRDRLRIRSLERIEDHDVPGSEHADGMFWSPDSATLGFSRDGRLWAWPLDRSESREIAVLPSRSEFNGGVWMPDGSIYFCQYDSDLYAVPAAGGTPEVVAARAEGELDFHLPAPLPGGREFVAAAHRLAGKQQIFVFSCGDRRRVPLLESDEFSAAAWSPAGYLLLMRNWTTEDVWAARYDPPSHTLGGEPFSVLPGLQCPSVAEDGSMVCVQGDRVALHDLLWVSRDGTLDLVPGGPFQGLSAPAVSPDGRRIAYSGVTDDNRDIWVLDVERGTRRRLTSERANEHEPRWSADGRTLFFERSIPGDVAVWRVEAEGGAAPVLVAEHASGAAPLPDGRSVLVVMESGTVGDTGLYVCALEPGATPVALLDSPFIEDQPVVSPDGSWLAYRSNETGPSEVFLRRLPEADAPLQVSIGGGGQPMWGADGDALYYLRGDEWMQVSLAPGDDPAPGRPQRVFKAADLGLVITSDSTGLMGRGLTPDGRRFLVGRPSAADPLAGILYFRNWHPAER